MLLVRPSSSYANHNIIIQYQFNNSTERHRRLRYKLYTNLPRMLPRKYFLLPDDERSPDKVIILRV
jgi:hypothetical protein